MAMSVNTEELRYLLGVLRALYEDIDAGRITVGATTNFGKRYGTTIPQRMKDLGDRCQDWYDQVQHPGQYMKHT